MPKGRLCIPSNKKDGEWFPHVGMTRKLPRTSAQDMLQQAPPPLRGEYRLPLICSTRRKTEVQNGYPFSAHDNRHLIQGMGEYFDTGLGYKKTSIGERQHQSQISFHDGTAGRWDAASLYDISYRGLQDTERPFCRRFPKHHTERSSRMKPLPENVFMWFADYRGAFH
uniref:Testis expressed 36 n=1 Tax=Leptobrachium leishanense TaxID=445787 RepID=A0A8C5PR39_9ANUR